MRIGFDVSQTCVERAGCAWYADSLAHAMSKLLGPADQLVLYHHFDSWLNETTKAGTRIKAPNVTMPLRGLSREEAASVWADPGHEGLGRPDIVHANTYRVPRVRGARTVLTVYDVSFWSVPQYTTDENRIACQSGTLRAMETVDGLIFISHSARAEFENILPGWIEDRQLPTAVVHLGSRAVSVRATLNGWMSARWLKKPYWLAVGTLEPRKNYENLLVALKLYRAQSASRAPLVIVGGDGWKSAGLRAEIASLESRGEVRYLGYVSDAKLVSLYRNALGLVFPSWYEGFGLPVLEALGHGCPVISSDRTSLREVGDNAVRYIDPAQPNTIADAMLALEAEKNLEAVREAGRAQARKFSWERAARATLQFYTQVLAHRV